MTLKNGTGQACAACKFQRRRCTPECLLAPFFPADQPKMFQSVHRLFGVKHVQNLLKELDPDQKPIAIKSIKFHAAMREKYPVYGCLVDIQQLSYQIQLAEEELQAVLQQLAYYRQVQAHPTTDDYVSPLQLGMAPPVQAQHHHYHHHQDNNNNNNNNNSQAQYNILAEYNNGDLECDKVNEDVVDDSFWMQQAYSYNNNNSNGESMVISEQPFPIAEDDADQDYNEMHPFFDNVDDRQSYIGPKETYESR